MYNFSTIYLSNDDVRIFVDDVVDHICSCFTITEDVFYKVLRLANIHGYPLYDMQERVQRLLDKFTNESHEGYRVSPYDYDTILNLCSQSILRDFMCNLDVLSDIVNEQANLI